VKRFNISATPAAILFRDRSMYPLDLSSGGPADADKVAAAVHAFVDGGYEHQVRRGGGGGGSSNRAGPGRKKRGGWLVLGSTQHDPYAYSGCWCCCAVPHSSCIRDVSCR
jgi:hypothetical protein